MTLVPKLLISPSPLHRSLTAAHTGSCRKHVKFQGSDQHQVGHPLHQQNPKTQYPGRRHVALHFLSQPVAEVAGTITWTSQPPQKCFSKRILNLRPSVTRLAWNLCEGVLPWLGFQSSQARKKMKGGQPMRKTSRVTAFPPALLKYPSIQFPK